MGSGKRLWTQEALRNGQRLLITLDRVPFRNHTFGRKDFGPLDLPKRSSRKAALEGCALSKLSTRTGSRSRLGPCALLSEERAMPVV
jgi:hypothetical protein